MIMVSSAPLATATSAMALNTQPGTPRLDAETTSSSGPEERDSSLGASTAGTGEPDQNVDNASGEEGAEQRRGIDLAGFAYLFGDVRRDFESDE